MSVSDVVKTLSSAAKKFKEPSQLFLCIKTVCGDKFAQAQLIVEIGKIILSLPDEIFYYKLEKFLHDAYLSDDDRNKMRAWIASNGNEENDGIRIISYINNAKSIKKIEYFANVTRAALAYDLGLSLYFRICDVIDMVLEEDLRLLADNINKNFNKEFSQSYFTKKLYSVGLMDFNDRPYHFGIYKFNDFAKLVDICALNFKDDRMYPNPKTKIEELKSTLNFNIMWSEYEN